MNHKWENNKCVRCEIIRDEISSEDHNGHIVTMYQYSDDGKNWVIKRPDCKETPVKSFSIKEVINTENNKQVKNYKQDYAELLKSPKWQRKRLEIMQRDNWRCKSCDDDNSELHVHHFVYTTNEPWMEKNENLITLCGTCHKAIHYLLSCPDIGMETFVLVIKLMDDTETESIADFIENIKEEVNG